MFLRYTSASSGLKSSLCVSRDVSATCLITSLIAEFALREQGCF